MIRSKYDRAWKVALFTCVFVIVGLSFPFSSPENYHFNWGSQYLFLDVVYWTILAFFCALVGARSCLLTVNNYPLLYWGMYFSAVIFTMSVMGLEHLNMAIALLLIFAAASTIRASRVPILAAIGAATSVGTLYGVAGALAARFGVSFDIFPIVPYQYDQDVNLGPGFYATFSPSLFLQTNAAGAIYGAAFCLFLYRLLSESNYGIMLPLAAFICLVGLVFTHSLSALLLVGSLNLIVLRGWALAVFALCASVIGAVILFAPEVFIGINAVYLQHKLVSSAVIK